MLDVSGKRVLVTGSTQGIGYAVAKAFADRGARVWVHGSREEKTKRAARQIGDGTAWVAQDLAEEGCAEALYKKTGDVDVLILNASVQFRTPWAEIPEEEFRKQIQINLYSSLSLMQMYAPAMQRACWGRIVTIGSVQQTVPNRDMAVYAASKAGLYSLVRNLAKQLAPDNVTVNNIAPGAMKTPRNEEAISDPAYYAKVLSAIPMGHMGADSDCNGICLLLASEEGSYITGADIYVDGGMGL